MLWYIFDLPCIFLEFMNSTVPKPVKTIKKKKIWSIAFCINCSTPTFTFDTPFLLIPRFHVSCWKLDVNLNSNFEYLKTTHTTKCMFWHLRKIKPMLVFQYWQKNASLTAKGALAHHLQCLQNPKWPPGAPKMGNRVWKGVF